MALRTRSMLWMVVQSDRSQRQVAMRAVGSTRQRFVFAVGREEENVVPSRQPVRKVLRVPQREGDVDAGAARSGRPALYWRAGGERQLVQRLKVSGSRFGRVCCDRRGSCSVRRALGPGPRGCGDGGLSLRLWCRLSFVEIWTFAVVGVEIAWPEALRA